jgi:AraC-like DNA-binding protein
MPKKETNRGLKVAVIQIKKFLDGHPHINLSTAALARQYGVSRNALQAYFKQRYKKYIGEYKLKVRLTEAQRLLRQGRSIKEVSIMLRYASPSSFSNAFKNYYNISASEWLNDYYEQKMKKQQERLLKKQNNAASGSNATPRTGGQL